MNDPRPAPGADSDRSILAIITAEHTWLDKLLTRIVMLNGNAADPSHKTHFATLRKQLIAHLAAEQQVLYPAVEGPESNSMVAVAAAEESQRIFALVDELLALPAGDAWKASLALLRSAVDTHIGQQEAQLFPKARAAIDADELVRIGGLFDAARKVSRTALFADPGQRVGGRKARRAEARGPALPLPLAAEATDVVAPDVAAPDGFLRL